MAEAAFRDQYSTVAPLFRAMPTWLSGADQRRIASYQTYEDIYWNVPEAFKLVQRGDDAKPIYIPSGRQIVDTLHRFLAPDIEVVSDPTMGSDTQRQQADQWLAATLARERFKSRFTANKRFGIIRGDWLFHIYADPDRVEGSRISILPVDPASYFPLYNDENIDEIIGCHIAEQFVDDDNNTKIRRLTYRKETEEGGPSPILMWDEIYEVDAWGQPGTDMQEKRISVVAEEVRLPEPIDSIPVYHIRNFTEPGNPFGSSELRGMEGLISNINQTVSDEDLTLALEGLGVYVTTSGPPQNEDGEDLPWNLGPARVVEIDPEAEFRRESGVTAVTPYREHIEYLHDQLDLGSGTPAVAKGEVGVEVAESGVALAIKMGPLLARSDEKENEITDVINNLLYDLRKFAMAYEPAVRTSVEAVRWQPVFGEKLPVNRKQRFNEIMTLVKNEIVSREWAIGELSKIGYDIGDATEMMNSILEEKTALEQVASDVTGARIDSELSEE